MPVRILDPHCVGKTFPDYFETLFERGHDRHREHPGASPSTAPPPPARARSPAPWRRRWATTSSTPARSTAPRRWPPCTLACRGDDEARLAELAAALDLHFGAGHVTLAGVDVTETLRLEEVGALASKISAWPAVREALRKLQLSFRHVPGLVADGRDMGTVIFPGADLKVFLTASAATRAERRYKQLISKGISANIDSLRADLEARDARDQTRSVAPLKPAAGCDAAGQLGAHRRSLGGRWCSKPGNSAGRFAELTAGQASKTASERRRSPLVLHAPGASVSQLNPAAARLP